MTATITLLVLDVHEEGMSVSPEPKSSGPITNHATKRVFMRAEHQDALKTTEIVKEFRESDIPDVATVVQRVMTYYGPRLRIEADNEQYLITAPGPDAQAFLWEQSDSGWEKVAEVCLDFSGSLPQYDICPNCGEPLSTLAHRRRSAIGTCQK